MSYINRLWKSYLAGEGYSLADVNNMIKRALGAETGDTGDINSLWMKYLAGEGYTDGDINSRMMQWLGAKGYSGGIDTRLRQALEAGDIFTAPAACSITLTGDTAAAFGAQPLDIAAQVVSKTVPASPSNAYVAGGDSSISSWSGWRAVGYESTDFTTAGNSEHALIVINSGYTTYVGLLYSEAGAGWIILVNGGVVGSIAGTATSKIGVRVDGASGDVEISVDGVVRTKATHASFGGLLSGAAILPVAVLGSLSTPTLTEGDTYSASIYTASADLSDLGFSAGTLDWCGNSI